VLYVVLAVFVLFQSAILLIFRTGDSVHWKRELAIADDLYVQGKFPEAAKAISEFGTRWPGAQGTLGWNEKMGRYYAAANDWKTAAEFFARAVAISQAPKLNALAGEAFWKAGNHEVAAKYLQSEIDTIAQATGDHDRAHFYLGLRDLDAGRHVGALTHFQSIADRAVWAAEIGAISNRLDVEIIAPARAQAESLSAADTIALLDSKAPTPAATASKP